MPAGYGQYEDMSDSDGHGRPRDTYNSDGSDYRESFLSATPSSPEEDRAHAETMSADKAGGEADAEAFYARGAAPSADSLLPGQQPPPFRQATSGYTSNTPSFDYGVPPSAPYSRLREPYPAWSTDAQIPLSKEEIEDVFIDLANKFGFQRDSMRNMYDHLMIQLDSRASRMSPAQALTTLHADYIGGEHANYRKWYFAAQLDLDDAIGQAQSGGRRLKKGSRASPQALNSAAARWRHAMSNMSQYDRLRQVALYLLCWGEAAQVRFTPECLCFIFKCADGAFNLGPSSRY